MKALDAVYKVLAAEGVPLHYRDITKRIVEQGLWQTRGKTPEATIAAEVGKEIRNQEENSRFKRTGPGMIGLREWGSLPIEASDSKLKEVEKHKPRAEDHLTFGDAAELVLDKYSDRQPMHYRVVTDRMLEDGLVRTQGQTPSATLYAQVLNEIKRQTRRGETPRFVRYSKGYIGLRKWLGEGLAFQIGRHNNEVRKKLLQEVRTMDWADFEALVARLLVAIGFEDIEVTNVSGDGGIDVRGTLVVGDVIRTRMAVQAKRWKKGRNVQAPTVQQVRGSLGTHEQGLIITTSDFSKGAQVEAERADAVRVALMNGGQLIELLIENDIGIHRNSYDLIELGEIDDSNVQGIE